MSEKTEPVEKPTTSSNPVPSMPHIGDTKSNNLPTFQNPPPPPEPKVKD